MARNDPRARHILDVLRRQPGGTFDAGLINGPRGKGTLVAIAEESLALTFAWAETPPPLCPIHLIIGLPRPQTARDILRDATTLGVAAMHFVRTDRGEASYADSRLWQTDEWQECVISGAAQAFCTRLPEVTCGRSLAAAIDGLPTGAVGLSLDNYEASGHLDEFHATPARPVALALGAERGWSAAERELLRARGFVLVHLGPRVLRTETACIAAVTLLKTMLARP